AVMKYKDGEKVSVFLKPSGYMGKRDDYMEPGSNGLLIDPEGRLVLMEHGDRRVSRLILGKKPEDKETLADKYMGKKLNSPNDGTLGKGKVVADYTSTVGKKGKTADGQPADQLPDGLKVDVKGNLWATGPGGLLVFTPAGKHLGTLATGVNTGNCCFGDDGST